MKVRLPPLLCVALLAGCAPKPPPRGAGDRPDRGAESPRDGRGGGTRRAYVAPTGKGGCGSFPTPGKLAFEFDFEGSTYEMPLVAPLGEGTRRAVVLLHGGRGGPASIVRQTGLFEQAGREGFVAVAPEAVSVMLPQGEPRNRWKNGHYDDDPSVDFPRDDVAFLDALASHLKDTMCVEHVLAVGFSNGGSMAHRWMCEGRQVDAVVSAAGTLQVPQSRCTERPRPVLEYIGTEDFRLDEPAVPGSGNPSALETVEFWKQHNSCSSASQVENQGDARCEAWTGCEDDAQVRICVIEGLGHVYPARGISDLDGDEDAIRWFEEVVE